MARRRGQGFARSVGAGVGAGLESLGDQIAALAAQRDASQLIQEQQSALSIRKHGETLQQQALTNPALAQKLIRSGLAKQLGLDIPQPTSLDLQAPSMELIHEAQSVEDLPTDEQMAASDQLGGGQFTTKPEQLTGGQIPIGIGEILARKRARDSRAAAFKRAADATPVRGKRITPAGVEEEYFLTQGDVAGQAFPTERPTLVEANRQGAVSGAQAGSAARAQLAPDIIAGEAKRAGAIKAAQEAVTIPTSGGRENAAKAIFDAYKQLSARINTQDGPGQIRVGLSRMARSAANLDNEAQLFQLQRKGLGILVAVLSQGTRPTDRDAKVYEDMLPGLTTPKGVAEPLIQSLELMFSSNPIPLTLEQILALPPGAPIPGVTPIGPNGVIQGLQPSAPTPPNPSTPITPNPLQRFRGGER